MTHAIAFDCRLTAAEWAAILARGIRADVAPGDWPAEVARLAERLSEMADARRADATIVPRRSAPTARRDTAILKAVTTEFWLRAIRLQSSDAE